MAAPRFSPADLRAMIPLYLDGELGEAEQAAVETYLAEHPGATGDLARAARLISLLDETIRPVEPPPDFTAQVMDQVRATGRGARWRLRWSLVPLLTRLRWAAELLLLLTLFALLWYHPWAPSVAPVECRVLTEPAWLAGQPVALRILVSDHRDGRPLAGARLTVSLAQGRRRLTWFEGVTNAAGTLDTGQPLPPGLEPGPLWAIARVRSTAGRGGTALAVELRQHPHYQVDLASARLPAGSDLIARVAATDAGSGRPLAEHVAPWRLTLGTKQLAAGDLRMSRWGQGLLRVPLADSLPPGELRLEVGADGATAGRLLTLAPAWGDALHCRLETAERWVLPGDTLRGAVLARRPAGPPAASAQATVTLRVGAQSTQVSGQLDALGRFDFALDPPPVSRPAGQLALALVEARVTSPEAEAGWAELRLPAAAEPAILALAPDQSQLVAGLDNSLALQLTRPDGSPVRANLTATFAGQQSELWTDSSGRATLTVQPQPGRNTLRLAAEVDGRPLTRQFDLDALPPQAGLALSAVAVGGTNAVYVTVRAADGQRRRVYLDLLADGRRAVARSLRLNGGQGALIVDLPPDLRGPLHLRAYSPLPDGAWLTGQTRLQRTPTSDLRLTLATSEDDQRETVEIQTTDAEGRPRPAELLLRAADRGLLAGSAADPAQAPPALAAWAAPVANQAADGYREAQLRARDRQRVWYEHATLSALLLGGLVLLVAGLYFAQLWRDPFEVVRRFERRGWGREPRVHRRGLWRGYGVLALAGAIALVAAGTLWLATAQAQALIVSARAEPGVWQPTFAAWPNPAPTVNADLSGYLPGSGSGDWTLLATDDTGLARWPWPARSGLWQVRAEALLADGERQTASQLLPAPPQLDLALEAPARLTVGDRLAIPLTVGNPLDLASPAVVTASAEGGLDLAAGPTQRVTLPRGGALRLSVPVVAAVAGAARLTVRLTSGSLSAERSVDLRLDPPGARAERLRAGWLDGRFEQTLDLPPLATGRRLELSLAADPRAPLRAALEQAGDRPSSDPRELAAQLQAAVLRHAWAAEDGLPAAARQATRAAVQRAQQRLLLAPYPVRPDAQAALLRALRAAEATAPADPRLVARLTADLRRAARQPASLWTGAGEQPSPATERAAWLLLALAGEADEAPPADLSAELARRAGTVADDRALALSVLALRAAGADDAAQPLAARLAERFARATTAADWAPRGAAPAADGLVAASTLETTAYVLRALAGGRSLVRTGPDPRAGAEWLWSQLRPDAAWGTARTTVAVVGALRALGGNLGGPARGTLQLALDGQPAGRATLDDEHDTATVAVVPRGGSPRLTLTFTGRGRPAWLARLAWTPPADTPPPSLGGLVATVTVPAGPVAPGGELVARLQVRNDGPSPQTGLVARLPLPPGFAAARRADGQLWLALADLAPGASREVDVPLRAVTSAARLTPAPGRLELADDPGRGLPIALPPLTIG